MTLALEIIGGITVLAVLLARLTTTATIVTAAVAADQHAEWRRRTVTSLSDAERLLDYLEATGSAERELVVLGNSRFAVRWR